jgi:hypothetical protein
MQRHSHCSLKAPSPLFLNVGPSGRRDERARWEEQIRFRAERDGREFSIRRGPHQTVIARSGWLIWCLKADEGL